jgi:ABC-type uncharacterized transport system ATPase subunit
VSEGSDHVPALAVTGVCKRYGPVVACDDVDLTVRSGEIHGLLGENGAGKSTLMKILLGLVHRDAGSISLRGAETEIRDPQQAAALGLGMVHQHFSLIEPLTVWENISLGDKGRIDRKAACSDVEEVAARYGLPIDPLARVNSLSPGQRQRVELIKCLRRNPSVLILDEPTSVLTQNESVELFAVLRRVVRSEGRAVVLISHKLNEIVTATDQVTVLRRGRVEYRGATAQTTPQELARQMVGRDVSLRAEGAALGVLPVQSSRPTGSHSAVPAPAADVPPALSLRGIRFDAGRGVLGPIDLDVAPGEILGLYGVEGNGQSALGDILGGLVVPSAGTIEIAGQKVDPRRPGALGVGGLGMIPEDRHHSGVVLDMSVAENLMMKSLDQAGGRFLLSRSTMNRKARKLIEEFGISTPSPDTLVRRLSGGNQQKVVLARELSTRPKVLVAAQPTHGLDVGAIEDMYLRLRMIASDGVGILLVTTELEEVMALSSRIAVISRGRIAGLLSPEEATNERLGLLVGGMAA